MTVIYIFYLSLSGILILLMFKIWELKKGSKPFSVLRYQLDILARNLAIKVKYYSRYISLRTFWLTMAFLVAKFSELASMLIGKIRTSKTWRTIKGKISPSSGTGPVSAFLRDVAEFKREAANEPNEEKKNQTP